MFEFIRDNSWAIGAMLVPVFYWVVRQIAKPLHSLAENHLPDGELKTILTDEEYEAKALAEYKKTTEGKVNQ